MTEAERLAIEWQCQKLCHQFALYNDQNDFKALCDLIPKSKAGKPYTKRFYNGRPWSSATSSPTA